MRPETQVVTHLCYSDFEDILSAIDALKGALNPKPAFADTTFPGSLLCPQHPDCGDFLLGSLSVSRVCTASLPVTAHVTKPGRLLSFSCRSGSGDLQTLNPCPATSWTLYSPAAADAHRRAGGGERVLIAARPPSCSKLSNTDSCSSFPPAADVLTIENSRSGDEMIRALSQYGYSRDLGPGVYDVHRCAPAPAAATTAVLTPASQASQRLCKHCCPSAACGMP